MGLSSAISLRQQTTTPAPIPPTAYNPTSAQTNIANRKQTQASISLTAETKTLAAADTVLVTLTIDSGSHPVDAADFVIHTDPTILQPMGVEPGTFFQQYPRQDVARDGTVTISGVADLQNNIIIVPKGTGIVATILYKAIKPMTPAVITIDREKTIIASGGKNIADSFTDLSLTIMKARP